MNTKILVAAILVVATLGLAVAPVAEAGVRVYVRVAPPPLRVEVIGVAPSPNHLWIGGFWQWGGREHVWVPGRWTVRARAGAIWVPGHWKRTSHGWIFTEGRWR